LQEDCEDCEVEASLGYILSLRPVLATEQDPVSKKTNIHPNKKEVIKTLGSAFMNGVCVFGF
jgi:hypothetical protein